MNYAKRVVLVEDEHDIAEMLRIFLEGRGYTFIHAEDGASGISACQKHMPHVILMDIVLPDMSGFDVCEHLHNMPSMAHIPVIFLTRRNNREERLRALELGAVDFVPKPFDPEELLLRVRNHVSYAAQSALIDQRSGLPGAFVEREYVISARNSPDLAVIETSLQYATPYFQRYGDDALRNVQAELGRIVVWAFDQADTDQGFAGYLDEDHVVVVCPVEASQQIAQRITSVFNFNVRKAYKPEDLQRGYLTLDDQEYPLMQVRCQVYNQDHYFELP